MFAAGKTAAVSGEAPDAQFNYVTMLLHGDGTNGAQNNTFLDSSTNNFTITRNGNTTQGSFSPYGSNWSNYFASANSDYLKNASGITVGSGNYTFECWYYTGGNGYLLCIGDDSTSTAVVFRVYSSGNLSFGYVGNTNTFTASAPLNTWNHVAFVRNSGTVTCYLNGSSVGTASDSTNISGAVTVGGELYSGTYYAGMTGYISNLRVTTTAVYTGSFTPSTTPLTAISGTQLLACQSNRFIDNSSNALALTTNGSPSVQRFNPFGTSSAYSTATIGGSGYFDGSGDSLSCTGSLPTTGDFTLSLWVYPTSLPGYTTAVTQSGSGNTFYLFLGYSNGTIDIQVGGSAYADYTSGVYKANQWNYVQVVKSSSAYSVYVNGTALSVTGSSGNIGTTSIASGTLTVSYNTGCYITDVRIVTSALSNAVPTAPLTAVSGTTMLLSMKNGAIYDNAMMNDLETAGNAQISTSVKKYGTGSLAFDGTGDYLKAANTPNLVLGTGDFTVEAWIYLPSVAAYQCVICLGQYTSNAGVLRVTDTAKLQWYWNDASLLITSTTSISANSWTHVAAVRSSGTTKLYINGVNSGSASDSNNYSSTYPTVIGVEDQGSYANYLTGYIDDLRITKGYARYTTTFTPPTAALPDKGPI